MLATLSLLCGDGPIVPVTPTMLPLQKHRLAMVQSDPGAPGPLLTDSVCFLSLKLTMLKCLGLPI